MSKNLLSTLSLYIAGSLLFLQAAPGNTAPINQDRNVSGALNYMEKMRTEIQQAQSKLTKAKEGDDLASLTLTTRSVPSLWQQFKSLSEHIKDIQKKCRSSSVNQNLSSDLSEVENIMKELDRVSKLNLKSASQDQLNKLSLSLDTLEQSLSEAEDFVLQSGLEDLKKSLLGDIEDMRAEVKDAFDRLAKAQEGDDLYEICVTRENLPNLKKQFDSLSEKIKEAIKNYGPSREVQALSSDISRIGTILEELETVAKANLKADTEAQLKKLSESLIAFQSRINK